MSVSVQQASSVQQPGEEMEIHEPPAVRTATTLSPPRRNTPPDAATAALSIASSGAEIGFEVARLGTQFGFGIAKSLVDVGAAAIGAGVDAAVGSNDPTRGPANGPAASGIRSVASAGLNAAQALALFGIEIGARITGATIQGADYSLQQVYGNREAVRALVQFMALVSREWNTVLETDPPGGIAQYSLPQVAKALAAWAVLQTATGPHLDGKRFGPHLQEIDLVQWKAADDAAAEEPVDDIDVKAQSTLPNDQDADFIEAEVSTGMPAPPPKDAPTDDLAIRRAFKRYSRICLGTYGGVGHLFFGVPLPNIKSDTKKPTADPPAASLNQFEHRLEECEMGDAEDESEVEDLLPDMSQNVIHRADASLPTHAYRIPGSFGFNESSPPTPAPRSNSTSASDLFNAAKSRASHLFDVITGSHDVALMEHYTELEPGSVVRGKTAREHSNEVFDVDDEAELPEDAESIVTPQHGRRHPSYYVITDRPAKAIVLVIRGTLSIDDVATDLTCEEASFEPYAKNWAPRTESGAYNVHAGMLEIATAIGGPRGPVTRGVAKALRENEGYELIVGGHSLGAGLAGLLTMLWADPDSGLTTRTSGLPIDRRVHAYEFAPPCTTSAPLSRRVNKIIHSFVLENDAVCRLSLGHIRDMRSAGAWLLASGEEGAQVFRRAKEFLRKDQWEPFEEEQEEELSWLIAMRTTLEAQMHNAVLYPAGDIYWLTKDLVMPNEDDQTHRARLFRITGKVERVFNQMIFSKSMLSKHLPQFCAYEANCPT